MIELIYKNAEYLAAVSYSSNYSGAEKEKEGYLEPKTPSKTKKLSTQQNNTIIALFSSLHFRLARIEKIIDKILTEVSKPSKIRLN